MGFIEREISAGNVSGVLWLLSCHHACLYNIREKLQSSAHLVWDNKELRSKCEQGQAAPGSVVRCVVAGSVSKYTPRFKCTSHFNCPNIDHPIEELYWSLLVISVKRVRCRDWYKASALMVMMLLFIDPHFISCRVSGKRFSLGEMDTWSSFSSWCTLRQKREQPSV